MRTASEQQTLYNWITLTEAGKRLGGSEPVSAEHVLRLGTAGELDIADLRLPGARRGVYRVDPASIDALLDRRTIGRDAA